jgi:hypothetical protein
MGSQAAKPVLGTVTKAAFAWLATPKAERTANVTNEFLIIISLELQ